MRISCENQPELCGGDAAEFNAAVLSGFIQYDENGAAYVIRDNKSVYASTTIPNIGHTDTVTNTDPGTGVRTVSTKPATVPVVTTNSSFDIMQFIKDHPLALGAGILVLLVLLLGGKK